MDIPKLATAMSEAKTNSTYGMLMMVKAKEQMEQQGDNIVKLIESCEVSVNDGKSLDVHV